MNAEKIACKFRMVEYKAKEIGYTELQKKRVLQKLALQFTLTSESNSIIENLCAQIDGIKPYSYENH